MKLPSTIRFADEDLKRAFFKLQEGDESRRELFRFVNQALDNMEKNAFCGIQIPKNLIPKTYVKKYGVSNLWKYDLPKGWRLIYTIKNENLIVISLVLEWMNHKDYEKRFGY
ncbi:hypothetical protein A3K63_05740 [Candidatus Micrarchaeota archaeon RBG_16_49_10]|nr:MAG: hypothetical protein A3K63_05740 [Candidatus Micrarchaeota archaeon RBG_16_49_10]